MAIAHCKKTKESFFTPDKRSHLHLIHSGDRTSSIPTSDRTFNSSKTRSHLIHPNQ
jgi:hypothetical protein